MASNHASWRQHLKRSAKTARTPLEDLPPPHYGPGHNLPPASADLDTVLRRDVHGYGVDFVNCPRIEVDPNIGLSLLMGLNDTITFRRHLTTQEHKIDAIDPDPPTRQIMDHIEREQALGKNRAVVMLRFPGVHTAGQTWNKTAGKIDANMIEMPVVIDIRESTIEEWKADKLAHNYVEVVGNSPADKVALNYGFATARDMQNSRPLGLNNYWLKQDENADKEQQEQAKTALKKSIGKIDKRLVVQHKNKETILAQLNDLTENGPSDDMQEAAALIEALEKEATPIREQMAPLIAQEQAALLRLKGNENEDERKTIETSIREIRQQLHPLHMELQPIATKIERATQRTEAVLEQKWKRNLATRDDEIEKLTRLKSEHEAELGRLEGTPLTPRTYAPTDHNPTLVSIKVLAANPRDYIAQLNADPNEKLTGKPKAVQEIYRTDIYPYALDNRPNGWLKDALGSHDDGTLTKKDDYKPDNSYIRATRRYFTHLFEQAKAQGSGHQSFAEFAQDPESVLGKAITNLNESAMSGPALSAKWRDREEDRPEASLKRA